MRQTKDPFGIYQKYPSCWIIYSWGIFFTHNEYCYLRGGWAFFDVQLDSKAGIEQNRLVFIKQSYIGIGADDRNNNFCQQILEKVHARQK